MDMWEKKQNSKKFKIQNRSFRPADLSVQMSTWRVSWGTAFNQIYTEDS